MTRTPPPRPAVWTGHGHADKTLRATLRGQTPEGEPTTVIVTRQGRGQAGRVWFTLNGAIRTTVVLTDPETGQLITSLTHAQDAR